MHHQGIFRIPGSQVEINDMKNAFEKGKLVLAGMRERDFDYDSIPILIVVIGWA